MELASSSVSTPSQCLAEGVACIRGSDSGGASHTVVASSSFSSSCSYGVFLPKLRRSKEGVGGEGCSPNRSAFKRLVRIVVQKF